MVINCQSFLSCDRTYSNILSKHIVMQFLRYHSIIFTFAKHLFATVQNLMNYINLIHSCPCNTLRTANSFARSDTGVVIDSEPHRSRTCKSSFLFAALAVRVHTGCSAFPFYTPTKPLMRLNIEYKIVLSPIL